MNELDRNLGALARANVGKLKAFSEVLISDLGQIEVLQSRTGLVMLPIRDTAQGVAFHLGEVLVSEAHIRSEGHEGYGMVRGRDLEASMAMAVVDLAISKGVKVADCTRFCDAEVDELTRRDVETLRRVEATRVNMETF